MAAESVLVDVRFMAISNLLKASQEKLYTFVVVGGGYTLVSLLHGSTMAFVVQKHPTVVLWRYNKHGHLVTAKMILQYI